MSQNFGITNLSVFGLVTAVAATTLAICPDVHAQMWRGGGTRNRIQPNVTSQPATVGIDTVADIQSTPTGTTNQVVTNAYSSGAGPARVESRAIAVTTPQNAYATTDTTASNGGLNANVSTNTAVINTPRYVYGGGQSYGRVNGGSGIAATNTLGIANYSPQGNSARGYAAGSVRGWR
jgi:hypothetical protein